MQLSFFIAKNHPLANVPLTLENFFAYPHITVSLDGGPNVLMETNLSELGQVGKVGLRVPH